MLVASAAVLAAAGFAAAHAFAQPEAVLQVTVPTVTVTLPVTTATVSVSVPTVSVPSLPGTTAVPTTVVPTTVVPTTVVPTTVVPTTAVPTTAVPTTVVPTAVVPPPPGTPGGGGGGGSSGTSSPGAPSGSAPGSAGAGASSGSSPSSPSAPPWRGTSGGLTVAPSGRRGRRPQSLAFRLGRAARVIAVFRGPAPSCEIAYTFRARGRRGANRLPASALVRKGIVEAGVYSVRVVAVRGERRQRIGEVVLDVRRLAVKRLPQRRHRCMDVAERGVLAAAWPTIDRPEKQSQAGSSDELRGGVAAPPEVELPRSFPGLEDSSGIPAAVFYGAVALALVALGGMAFSVGRAFR